MVYKIRNKFAHGAFTFPEPAEWNEVEPHDIQIIETSSRIVLLTTQMLILAIDFDLSFNVAELGETPDENGVGAGEFLFKMHQKEFRFS